MPRVSSASEDAFHFKGSFADGFAEVIDCKAVVFQFPPNKDTNAQDPPGLFAELTLQRYDNGEFTSKTAAEPESVLLSICKADKLSGELNLVHPGQCEDNNYDNEPTDATGALGAEGNTLYAVSDGFQLNDKTKWMRFCKSLEEKGFKPAILKRTFFPDLIGLRGYFKTITLKNESFTGRTGESVDPTAFVADQIKKYPYETGSSAGKATAAGKTTGGNTSKGAKTQTAKPSGAASAAPAATSGGTTAAAEQEPDPLANGTASNGAATAEDIATAILVGTLANAKKGVLFSDVKKLKVDAFLAISKHKPPVPGDLKKAVQDQLGNEEWLLAIGQAHEVFVVNDNNSIQFNG